MTPSTLSQTTAPVRRPARQPVVSVCIVNWNCRDLLRDCLRSLRTRLQKLRLEIVVVDNGSTDGAADMVEREFPQVRLVRNSANRPSRACPTGRAYGLLTTE